MAGRGTPPFQMARFVQPHLARGVEMRITERLNAEHGIFLVQLGFLEELAKNGASADALHAGIRMLTTALDAHCRVEDARFYPLIKTTLGNEAPALKVLKNEHEQIERYLTAAQVRPCNAAFVTEFVAKLKAHIENEIHFLFPIVEEWLSEESLQCNWNVDHVKERLGASCGWSH
jgi:hemerythrin-like domain-containing protein